MKTVIVGFSRANNLFSKLIMWATQSNISHTYIRLGNIVYQASGLKVNEVAYEYFLTYETVVGELELEVTDDQWAIGEKFRIDSLGKPYSIREIIGFGWVLLLRGFGKTVPNPLKDGDRGYVCASLVMKYLGMDNSGENVDPDMLYDTVKKLSKS